MAANTFNKGLQLDVHPLSTPNDVMTSCLNGTLLTYNGNEFMLQTDMGNGRVETAYLPEGYVPLGIVEFGGVIYVASYNPFIDKSQIGSFPSPERNISTEELNRNVVSISNADFGFNNRNNGASVFYVQKNLYEEKLTPGDKFIVYTRIGSITGNEGKLFDFPIGQPNFANGVTKCVELYFATITNEGKIVRLANLKEYKINGTNKKYIIPEISYNGGSPMLDSYRSIISSPYNVFNSKVSGKLLLIAELVTIDEFNVSISCEFEGEDTADTKNVLIYTILSYTSKNNVFVYGVKGHVSDSGSGASNKSFIWSRLSTESNSQIESNRKCTALLYTVNNYDYKNRPERNIKYEITPCMPFGPINYLMRSGIIQLDKIGTGYIELYEWRYYIDNSGIMINWALQSYPEEGYMIAGVRFVMSCYDRNGNLNTCVYNVSKKESYNGSFTENIPFNSEYYKIKDGKTLLNDRLYYVTIEVQYQKINSGNTSRYKYFHKWLYTSDIFNKKYIEGEIIDFEPIIPELSLVCDIEEKISLKSSQEKQHVGDCYIEDKDGVRHPDNLNSMCSNMIKKSYSMDVNLTPRIENTYNVFKLDNSTVTITVNILNKNKSVEFDDYSIKSSNGVVDIDTEEYLKLKEYKEYNGNNIQFPDPKNSKVIVDDPYNSGIYIKNEKSNLTLPGDKAKIEDIQISIVEFVKAYAKLKRTKVVYNGTIRPLAYDAESFSRYNMTRVGNHFKSISAYAWGQAEKGGDDGRDLFTDVTNGFGQGVTLEGGDGRWSDVTSDDMANAMAKAWGATSPIVMAIWTYGGYNKSSVLFAPVGASYNPKWYKWYSNINNGGHCTNYGYNRLLEDTMAVHMMWRRISDKRYVLTNFVTRVGTSPGDTRTLRLDKTVCKNMTYTYDIIAAMLMQLYSYSDIPENSYFWLPDSIYYIERFITNFGIGIDFNINTSESTKVLLETDNESKIYIDTSMRNNLFNENKKITNNSLDVDSTSETVDNNIKFKYNGQKSSVNAKIQTLNSGISLFDKLSEFIKTEYGAMVYKCDGTQFPYDINGNIESLYYVTYDNNAMRMNSKFEMYNVESFNLADNMNYKAKLGTTIINDRNSSFANSLKVEDGVAYINDGNVPQTIQCNRSQGGEGDDGGVGKWNKFAPISDLKLFL